MSVNVSANFPSMDMATLAVKSISTRMSGVKSVRVSYHREHDSSVAPAYNLFLPSPTASGFYTNETMPYGTAFLNLGDVPEPRIEGEVRVELKVTGDNLAMIKSNLRNYGGLNVKVTN